MAIARRPTRPVLIGVGVLAVIVLGFVLLHKKSTPKQGPPAIPVTVAKATTADFPIAVSALGAAQAWKSDTIFAQVSGVLTRVNFSEGSFVKAGQVLAEVDPATYRAAVTQAEGQLQRDQAVLAEAKTDLARYLTLLSQDSISRQQAEDQQQVVKQDEGTVRIDQGVLDNARINLDRCRIVSPISGRAGVRLVDAGNLVSASGSVSSTPSTSAATSTASAAGSSGSGGGSGIVVINQIMPIAVTFTVPEGDFQRLVEVSARFSHPLAVQAFSQETGALIDNGQLGIADNRVDPSTGTVELKASFPNAAERLWPGQFVNVRLLLQTVSGVTVVPATAVNRGPKGPFVFVVGPGGKAIVRPVSIGDTQGELAMVKSGVRPGEMVVIDGQMTLKNGSRVRVAKVQSGATAP
jgi:multidrug efflux system membrane fusion protein